MKLASPFSSRSAAGPASRPRDDELDLFGVTHPGRVRHENQDQFLLCTVHPQVIIHGTSLPATDGLALRGQRLATIMLVADGVGGSAAGSRASRIATEAVTQYVATALRCYHTAGSSSDSEFAGALRAAAIEAHDVVRAEALVELGGRQMATTLSLGIVVWPWLYVLQVGDSRCYFYQDGRLRQVTRDQTIAQNLVDEGILRGQGIVRGKWNGVKVLATGDLTKAIKLKVDAISAAAKEKIEKAGGTAELIPTSKPAKAAAAG